MPFCEYFSVHNLQTSHPVLKKSYYSLQSADSNPTFYFTMNIISKTLRLAYNEWYKNSNKIMDIIHDNCLRMRRLTCASHFTAKINNFYGSKTNIFTPGQL